MLDSREQISSGAVEVNFAGAAQTNARPRVAIIGAGPAGLGAAWQLQRRARGRAIVVEQGSDVGGNAGSFELDGLMVDYGSHRLHPACAPHILDDLRALLGEDLLDRPRHGRIRLRERWIHFPLKPLDLLLRLPWSFGAGVTSDALRKLVAPGPRDGNGHETFTGVLERGLGATICRDFYFPYAVKIWGVPPEQLSAIQARRRVSAGSFNKLLRKMLGGLPGNKVPGAGRFYYPREGYGQICRAITRIAREQGAEVRLGASVRRINLGRPHRIEVEQNNRIDSFEAEYVWSTIPITTLARIVNPAAPAHVIEAGRQIKYRAMILIYLVLDQPQFTPYDAHYFPETEIKLTRLSEPKNYSVAAKPPQHTILCGELPCDVGDRVWQSSDEELTELMRDSLARCGLPIRARVLQTQTKRLPHAYPIYQRGYETHFAALDEWANSLDNVLTFGRQGLFAHDNTHHALAMAYAAVDCLREQGTFDEARWRDYRTEFAKHVVED